VSNDSRRDLPHPAADDIELTAVLSALADPVRLHLMRGLWSESSSIDCSLVSSDVDVTAATVSHHFRVLRESGLTLTQVEGRKRYIEVRRDDLERRFPGLLTAVLASS
jgi:DNA-binding transcriptional ArsR family regulator